MGVPGRRSSATDANDAEGGGGKVLRCGPPDRERGRNERRDAAISHLLSSVPTP